MAIDLRQALVEEGFVVHGENKSVGLTQPALEAVWHGKLWSGTGDNIICRNQQDYIDKIKLAVSTLSQQLKPGCDHIEVSGEDLQSLVGKICWLHFPVLSCLPFLGRIYNKLHYELVQLRKVDLDMLKNTFDVLITQPLIVPRSIGEADAVFPCKALWHPGAISFITDFAEICSLGAIVRICVCGHKQVMQLTCPMVQGPGEVFTFHNGLLHALSPERCVDPYCPSHDPNVPVILLGDNGTARRSNIFTGSMSYYSRRLAKRLARGTA